MNLKNCPEIRADDVLQTTKFTKAQRAALDEKSMFEWFLESDAVFEKYNHPCILACLSEGIEDDLRWVEHIRKNQHRYIIELHGSRHYKYGQFSSEELYEDLFRAKNKIEDTFGCHITTWYVPFGRKGRNPHAEKVCNALDIKLGIPEQKVDAKLWLHNKKLNHCNFHFWRRDQIGHVQKILETIYGKEI